jgi:hypothetical protein
MMAISTNTTTQFKLKQLRLLPSVFLKLSSVLIFVVLLSQTSLAQNDAIQPVNDESKPTRTSAAELLREAQMIHIQSSTKFFDPFQLESELQKQSEFTEWNLMLVDRSDAADIQVEIDRPLFTYTFNYRVVDRKTRVVLATGKVSAINGSAAAPKLAKEILQQVKEARPPQASKLKLQADFIDETLTMPALPKELKKPTIQQGAKEALTKAPLIIARPPAEPPQ